MFIVRNNNTNNSNNNKENTNNFTFIYYILSLCLAIIIIINIINIVETINNLKDVNDILKTVIKNSNQYEIQNELKKQYIIQIVKNVCIIISEFIGIILCGYFANKSKIDQNTEQKDIKE